MLDTAPNPLVSTPGAAVRVARVESPADEDGHVRVRLDDDPGRPPVRAGVGLAGGRLPTPGDRVLLAFTDRDQAFVIGLLRERAPTEDPGTREIPLTDGSTVRISGGAAPDRLALLSEEGRPLLEYDAEKGRIRISAPAGDLELMSVEGDLVLNAAGAVRMRGRVVEATGESHVRIGVENASRRAVSLLSLDPSTARLAGPVLTAAARRAQFEFEETAFTGSRLTARVGSVTAVVRRLETVADEIHERAGRVYTAVRELLEVRAGRIRTLVRSSYRLKADRAHLKADEDFKIKGDQIHLG